MGIVRIDRRTALLGAAGAAIALPWLEIMEPIKAARALASTAPMRYLVCYCGSSIGGDEDNTPGEVVPTTVGPGYDLKTALAPLGIAGVQPYVSVVSGLTIPEDNSPAGFDHFHGGTHSALLTGVHNGFLPGGGEADSWAMGTSSDQIVADAMAPAGLKYKHLPLRVQVSEVRGAYRVADSLVFRMEGGTMARKLSMESSPQAAYESLFFNFTKGSDPAQLKAVDLEWRKRKSVLDFVRDSTQRLSSRLGTTDKKRLELHLNEVRDLEMQVGAAPMFVQSAACDKLPPFGDDPPVSAGYSNEEARAKLMCDIMYMALTCDQTRVGTLLFTMPQCFMSAQDTLGLSCTHHDLGHFGAGADTNHKVALGIAWQMKHFGYLVNRLAQTPDTGATLLDNSAIAFLFEGGHGPQKGDPKGKLTAHSGENMAVLVAGKAGGLKAGNHIVAKGSHPANVLVTCMNAVGVATQKLGNVSGEIPGLRG